MTPLARAYVRSLALAAGLLCGGCGGGMGMYEIECERPEATDLSAPSAGFEIIDRDGSTRYYIINADASQSFCGSFAIRLDDTGTPEEAHLLEYESGAIDLASRAVTDGASLAFVAEREESSILFLYSISGRLVAQRRVFVGIQPGQMAFDPARKQLYVASATSADMVTVDAETGSVTGRVALQDTDTHPVSSLAVGPGGYVWMGYREGYVISRYDPDRERFLPLLRPLGTAAIQSPAEMLRVGDEIWAAFPADGVVLALDADGQTVRATTEFFAPGALRRAGGRLFIGDVERFVWVDTDFTPIRYYEPLVMTSPVALYFAATMEFVTAGFAADELLRVGAPQ